jgi:hypothetical protein
MSGAPFAEKLITTDTDASKAARTKLTAALAELNPAGGILDQGDGSGRHADKTKKKAKTKRPLATASPNAPTTAASDPILTERAAKFDRLDKDKHGQLTLDEYVARQSDPVSAKKRFEKFDTNHDGAVTREGYLANGAKKPKRQ